MNEWDLNNDSRMGFAIMIGGYIHHAILVVLGMGLAWFGVRRALRSAWADRWLNSGHYGAGSRKGK